MESIPYEYTKSLSLFYLSVPALSDVDGQDSSSNSGPSGAPPSQSVAPATAGNLGQGHQNSSHSKIQQNVNSPQANTATGSGHNWRTILGYFIFLVVTTGDRHRLAQLPVDGLGDDHFFKLLRRQYLGIRGCILNIFSIWKFSHCDFIMVSPMN
jgi:hypothetical protein